MNEPTSQSCAHSPGLSFRATGLILLSALLLMLPGAWGHSATVVEYAELPAGLAAWQRHTLGVYRVCGPLSKLLYALPAHLGGVRVAYPTRFDDADGPGRIEWEVGRRFQEMYRPGYLNIYRWLRLIPMMVTLLGGVLIGAWSARLFGRGAGLVSLCLWTWMAPVLANGSLLTSDGLSAVLTIAAARTFWALLMRPNPANAALAGLLLGLAVATKFTLLVLYPCWVILLMARAFEGNARSSVRWMAWGLLMVMVSVLSIDAAYLFQGLGFRLADWDRGVSSLFQDVSGLADRPAMAWLLRLPLPLPIELWRGLDVQLADTERLQSAYLLGQTKMGGWWYWYLAAFLIKVPLPALLLILIGSIYYKTTRTDGQGVGWAALCVLFPALEIALAIAGTTGTGTNAAFRYLLPSLALLCVWSGRVWKLGGRRTRAIVLGLLAWLAVDAVAGVPDHLGWRNELGWLAERTVTRGRPALIGDSLDWGQDLARLGDWVRRQAAADEGKTLVFAYGLGAGEPYGLEPATAGTMGSRSEWGGYRFVAVSADVLYGYEAENCVSIGGVDGAIDAGSIALLLGSPSAARVGRTIRVYRLADLDQSTDAGQAPRSPGGAVPQPSLSRRVR